jgi:hypothetical protein
MTGRSLVAAFLFWMLNQSCAVAGGEVYWYVDENGVTHFASQEESTGGNSGNFAYEDIPDDSVVTNPNGTTTTVINSSQFGDGTYRMPDSSSDVSAASSGDDGSTVIRRGGSTENVSLPQQQENIVKDKSKIINLSNRPMYEDDFE